MPFLHILLQACIRRTRIYFTKIFPRRMQSALYRSQWNFKLPRDLSLRQLLKIMKLLYFLVLLCQQCQCITHQNLFP